MDDITDSVDMSLSKLWEMLKDREAWCAMQSMGSQKVGHERLNNNHVIYSLDLEPEVQQTLFRASTYSYLS